MENGNVEHSAVTHCYAVRQMAEQRVEQWECHDKFRLVEGGEPQDVMIAQEFLRLLSVVEQANASGFTSLAANGVLSIAVQCHKKRVSA